MMGSWGSGCWRRHQHQFTTDTTFFFTPGKRETFSFGLTPTLYITKFSLPLKAPVCRILRNSGIWSGPSEVSHVRNRQVGFLQNWMLVNWEEDPQCSMYVLIYVRTTMRVRKLDYFNSIAGLHMYSWAVGEAFTRSKFTHSPCLYSAASYDQARAALGTVSSTSGATG